MHASLFLWKKIEKIMRVQSIDRKYVREGLGVCFDLAVIITVKQTAMMYEQQRQ